MGIRFTHDFVKNEYKKKSIQLIGNYRNLFKKILLRCELCKFEWDDNFDPDKELICPKCLSITEKVKNKSKSGRRNKKLLF